MISPTVTQAVQLVLGLITGIVLLFIASELFTLWKKTRS
jgi:hypothetical protein